MRFDVGAGRVQCARPRNLCAGDPTDQWPLLLPESPLLSLPLFELLSLGLGLGLSGAFVFTVTSEPFVDAFAGVRRERVHRGVIARVKLPSASLSVSPAFCSACLASLSVMPFRLGTRTFSLAGGDPDRDDAALA